MLLLRRALAFVIAASLAGSQPAAATCAMVPATVEETPDSPSLHAHHAVAAEHGAQAPGTTDPSGHPGADEQSRHDDHKGCDFMMACTAAAPSEATAVVPAALFSPESSVGTPASARAAPTLAFEPPPPRAPDLS